MSRTEYTPLQEAQQFYSDYHKDLYGFRPRSDSAEQWNSLEWLDARIAELRADQPRVEAEEIEARKAAIRRFEFVVEQVMQTGARDRQTAIRWLRDVEGDGMYKHDDGYFEYTQGLPYGYLKSAWRKVV